MRCVMVFLAVSASLVVGIPDEYAYRLACTADTNLSSYEHERRYNYGAAARIRLKGIQMLGLLRFDTAPIHGMRVRAARLHLRYAGPVRMLRTLGISTTTVPWQEGDGRGEEKPGQVCFQHAELGVRAWKTGAADFAEVVFGPPNLWGYTEVREDRDGWISADLPPAIVQALAAGVATGIVVTDEKGQTYANNDVFAREQAGSEPYLTVDAVPSDSSRVPTISGVAIEPDPQPDMGASALRVAFTASEATFAVRATIVPAAGGPPVFRDVLAIRQTGPQRHRLWPLPPSRTIRVTIQGVDACGRAGPPFVRLLKTPGVRLRPTTLPSASWLARLRRCPDWHLGGIQVAVTAADARVAPTDTKPVPRVQLWNGRELEVHVARGERAALVLLFRGPQARLREIKLCCHLPFRTCLSTVRCVGDALPLPEACLPMTGVIQLSDESRAASPEPSQQIVIEWLTPPNFQPGVVRGRIKLTCDGDRSLSIPLAVHVHRLTLPQPPVFQLALNTYGSPARLYGVDPASSEGIRIEHDYHRVARAHGATLMPLGYSHSGIVEPGYAPATSGSGDGRHVSDWSDWDRRFGPLLAGTAFRDDPAGAAPITDMYLPLHEAWPEDIRVSYRYSPRTRDYPAVIIEHALVAGPLEEMLLPGYGRGIRNVLRDFAEHIRSRGWHRTRFHYYLNNKYYYRDPAQGGRGTSWWLLDEPMHRDDWLALAWFARQKREALAGLRGHGILFRADISRPQWQRDYLDGLVDLMVVNDELFSRQLLVRRFKSEQGIVLWHYGSPPGVEQPLAACEYWPVRAYLAGATGIVPWQSLGNRSNYREPEATALLLPGPRPGDPPVPTLRLKALGRGQQTAEYLRLLTTRYGWTLAQTEEAVKPYLRSGDFAGLRAAILQRLAPLGPHASDRTQERHSAGHAPLALPRSPNPNP